MSGAISRRCCMNGEISEMGLANRITVARLWFAALAFDAIFYEKYLAALVCVVAALLSDILDGYVARRLGQQSSVGDKLDHLADLVLLGLPYLTLAAKQGLAFPLPVWLASAVLMHAAFQVIAWLLQVIYCESESKPATPRTSYGRMIFGSQIILCCLAIAANLVDIPDALLTLLSYCVGAATLAHFAIDSFSTKSMLAGTGRKRR
jgi:phosphatidylglycerophosphate synthase